MHRSISNPFVRAAFALVALAVTREARAQITQTPPPPAAARTVPEGVDADEPPAPPATMAAPTPVPAGRMIAPPGSGAGISAPGSDMVAVPPSGGGMRAPPNMGHMHMGAPARPFRPIGTIDMTRTRPPVVAPQPTQIEVTQQSVEGALPPASIARVVRSNEGAIATCYSNSLMVNPSVQGLLVLRFVIGPNGAVMGAEYAADFVHDEPTTGCILGVAQGLRFATPRAGIVQATYRIMLRQRRR